MGTQYNPKIVTDGLALCLDASNTKSYPGSGTTWSDLSGNNQNGTLTNGPVFTGGRAGYFTFDGADDYVSTNLLVDPSVMTTTTWMTAVYPTGISYNTVATNDDAGYDRGFQTSRFNDNTFHVFIGDAGTWTPTTSTTNTWVIVTIVYDSNNVLFYKNDIRFSRGSSATGQASTLPLRIGSNPSFAERYNGRIGIFLVYNRALSNDEILQNFYGIRGRYGL